MSNILRKGALLLAVGCSASLFAGDLPDELFYYMLPPSAPESVEPLPQIANAASREAARPAVSAETAPVVAPRPVPPSEKSQMEVVFVLDTTGSMSGLIAAAKDKIWAIANTLALAEPAPEIKLGLVGYRDRGDEYITTLTDLTTDLDAVYAALMTFEAAGGGDAPESVNQALHEAVTKINWSTDDTTHRVIYLVGDAPPHMDYANDVAYTTTCEQAVRRDILINTIQCGSMAATTPFWQEIASLAEGQFFQIAQDGGAIVRETPFDAKLAELATKLDATRLYYGTAAEQAQGAQRAGRAAGFADVEEATGALARRALFNSSAAGAANFLGKQELVNDFANGSVALDDLKSNELPETLRKLSKADLEKLLKTRAAEREELQAEIRKLADERQKFLEAELANEKSATPELDLKLYRSIQTQAGEKGFDYNAAAPAF